MTGPPEDPWVPPGSSVKIKGLVIPDGMLYVGRRLDPAGFGREVDPALIDPSLPVFLSEPDFAGSSLGYGLSYSRISPRARAGYLHWLWSRRQNPSAPIGYVYLYFFGLERRILHDRVFGRSDPGDLAAIRAEVDRLRRVYGSDGRFGVQAARFSETLEVLARIDSEAPGSIPAPAETAGELPPVLRFELARIAAGAGRLPATWALAWVRQAPDIRLRAAAERCGDEFDRLFLLRYRARYGDGLALSPAGSRLRIYYRPASSGFSGEVRLPVGDLPDPSAATGPTRRLNELAQTATDELAPFARLVGRRPEMRGSLAALSLLPAELASGGEADAADRLVERAEAALGDAERVRVDASVIDPGPPDDGPQEHAPAPADDGRRLPRPVRVAEDNRPREQAGADAADGSRQREQAAAVARVLEARGIGVEPDVRFGGPPPGEGRVVLFRTSAAASSGGTPVTVSAAAALVHLVATVIGTGPDTAEEAVAAVGTEACSTLGLGALGPERVTASLWWTLGAESGAAGPGAPGQRARGLKRRLATLDRDRREAVGRYLVTLAARPGPIGPPQMVALGQAWAALGLDDAGLFGLVHQSSFDLASLDHPPSDHPPSDQPPLDTGAPDPSRSGPRGPARLDGERIRARLAETAEVAAFLGKIFVDDETPAPPTVAGLDRPHTELLAQLARQPEWTRAEIEALAGSLDLLPDGALDTLNEVAIDRTGEPLCEGDDPIEIDGSVLQELLPR